MKNKKEGKELDDNDSINHMASKIFNDIKKKQIGIGELIAIGTVFISIIMAIYSFWEVASLYGKYNGLSINSSLILPQDVSIATFLFDVAVAGVITGSVFIQKIIANFGKSTEKLNISIAKKILCLLLLSLLYVDCFTISLCMLYRYPFKILNWSYIFVIFVMFIGQNIFLLRAFHNVVDTFNIEIKDQPFLKKLKISFFNIFLIFIVIGIVAYFGNYLSAKSVNSYPYLVNVNGEQMIVVDQNSEKSVVCNYYKKKTKSIYKYVFDCESGVRVIDNASVEFISIQE